MGMWGRGCRAKRSNQKPVFTSDELSLRIAILARQVQGAHGHNSSVKSVTFGDRKSVV